MKFYSLVPLAPTSGLFDQWPSFPFLLGLLMSLLYFFILTANKIIPTVNIDHTHIANLYNNFIVTLHFYSPTDFNWLV